MNSGIRVIAISGGSGSGKTTFAGLLAAALGGREGVAILFQDSYYRDQSRRFDHDGGAVNFDHPDSLDFELLGTHLSALRGGACVDVPVYRFASHTRANETERLEARPVVLVDGTLLLHRAELLPLFDWRVFIDAPREARFERRLKRDVLERGREPEGVRRQFELQVSPMHDRFVQPSAGNADLVIAHGDDLGQRALEVAKALGNVFP